jgi:hypothetical protein
VTAQNRKAVRSRAKSTDEMEHALSRLQHMMMFSLAETLNRVKEATGHQEGGAIRKARGLLTSALDPKNLCMQDTMFHPWF